MVKASTEGLGLRGMLKELGAKVELEVETDSSATKGITARSGNGKLKHLEVGSLWVQEKASSGEIRFRKIPRSDNCADLLAHHCSPREMQKHLANMNVDLMQLDMRTPHAQTAG